MKLIVILETGNNSNIVLKHLIHGLISLPIISTAREETIISLNDHQEVLSLESLLFVDFNNSIELHVNILNADSKSKKMLKRHLESKLKFYENPIGTKPRLKFIPAGHRG